MPLPAHWVNFANVGASPEGIIRLDFGDATMGAGPDHRPEPFVAVVMSRERAQEIARILNEVLTKSALPPRQ